MANFKIEWLEKKSPEWVLVSLKAEDGSMTTDVSINEKDKSQKIQWPNFSSLMVGQTIEGNLWTSSQGKTYLFPLRPETPKNTSGKTHMVKEAQETKARMISTAQDNKYLDIKISSTMRGAVDIALRECEGAPFESGVFKSRVKEWRKWLWENFDAEDKDFDPFPNQQ